MAKQTIAAPIDRPLSKAYLRKFKGWSTAAAPGTSDPTTLREMHNCYLTPDKSVRVRPGLRHVLTEPTLPIVGTFEHFYTEYDTKAILFAVRETDNTVGWRIGVWNELLHSYDVMSAWDPTYGFQVPASDGGLDWDWAHLRFSDKCTYVKYVQIDNKILALGDSGETFRLFKVGATRTMEVVAPLTFPRYQASDKLEVYQPTEAWINGSQTTLPPEITKTEETLVSTNEEANLYNFAYFYTFSNEIGESAPSQVTQIRLRESQSRWDANAEDDTKAPEQLVAVVPELVWQTCKWQKARRWNLYMLTWSDQDAVPVEGVLLRSKDITDTEYAQTGWIAHTPLIQGGNESCPLPNEKTLENYTEAAKAGNGVVAGDRVVLVYDRTNHARITWSSGQQGEYLNFTGSRGGGYKTLTSGNLFFPAAVKLWQNPQSVDTLVVLCTGLDGYGTSYYMNPSTTISAQNQTTTVMGFEETTATPGTTSPYGVEVLNSGLYHPLESNLMKTTAANYRISHSYMADDIANIWRRIPLSDKRRMVSSQLGGVLYYLVQSPLGWEDATSDNGNQIWLCDTEQEGAWSCWDIRGTSLRKMELNGLLYMTVVQDGNIFALDPDSHWDETWDGEKWKQEHIEWEIIINTHGANRSHDAWCMLQQANVTFGSFVGECEYGVRGTEVNGRALEVKKVYRSQWQTADTLYPYDNQDMLLIRRHMMEWEFFWRSTGNFGHGEINFIQYRYTPASVNVGYEYGSIETFEYGTPSDEYVNGIPTPFADVSKP